LLAAATLCGQQKVVWSAQEQPIVDRVFKLRKVPDSERSAVTRDLALQIRQLPLTTNKLTLATALASLSTEGDYGRETLQEVATTLALALKEQPHPEQYMELAQLVKYEHVTVPPDPQLQAAISKLEEADRVRQNADFALPDLNGKTWELKKLQGKVVLVNFWATWCPPCRKELPDLEAIYQRFGPQGFVVLAISDEEAAKVKPFVAQQKLTYPILLDQGRKVNDLFEVQGIPKTFVYNREGKLIAESIDMRTQRQFLEMLKLAGLE
jgi:peroxiredoxin